MERAQALLYAPAMSAEALDPKRNRMTEIAERFHALRGAPGVRPFDPERLDAWAVTAATSEAMADCARFVLGVWNQSAPWRCGRFDAMRALGRWDAEHRAAFVAWARDPYFP
jgi:hypothetical protein